MAYPIRYRLKDRETGEVLRGGNDKTAYLGWITPDGQPMKLDYDFYIYESKLNTSDYILEVALEKDKDGSWIYEQVGY